MFNILYTYRQQALHMQSNNMGFQFFWFYDPSATAAQVVNGWFHTLYIIFDLLSSLDQFWLIVSMLVNHCIKSLPYTKSRSDVSVIFNVFHESLKNIQCQVRNFRIRILQNDSNIGKYRFVLKNMREHEKIKFQMNEVLTENLYAVIDVLCMHLQYRIMVRDISRQFFVGLESWPQFRLIQSVFIHSSATNC